jgi:hypothetical protein
MTVVFLDRQHPHQLPAPVIKFLESLDFRGGQRADDGWDDLTEAGQDTSIDFIGLARMPSALAKSRTCRALTTTAGNEAASRAPTAAF